MGSERFPSDRTRDLSGRSQNYPNHPAPVLGALRGLNILGTANQLGSFVFRAEGVHFEPALCTDRSHPPTLSTPRPYAQAIKKLIGHNQLLENSHPVLTIRMLVTLTSNLDCGSSKCQFLSAEVCHHQLAMTPHEANTKTSHIAQWLAVQYVMWRAIVGLGTSETPGSGAWAPSTTVAGYLLSTFRKGPS